MSESREFGASGHCLVLLHWSKIDLRTSKVASDREFFTLLPMHQSMSKFDQNLQIDTQSNLCTTATLGTLKLRPLLTGGHCSEVAYIIKIEIGPLKWWPL
jgi:hypothetical protein